MFDCVNENNITQHLFSENKHNYPLIYYRIFAKIKISDKFLVCVRNFRIDVQRQVVFLNIVFLNNSINEFNKSIEMNEKNPEAYYNRSVAYYRQKKWKEAKKDIEKALTYNPKNEFYRKAYERFYKNI